MSLVNLASGGLDSSLIGVLAREEGIKTFPLFIDYGQVAAQREWDACQKVHSQLGLARPTRMDISGFGRIILSGLTDGQMDVKDDAFTPGRNLVFLLMGSCFAHQVGANMVSIGLLDERFSLFPDQRKEFVSQAERTISTALGHEIKIVTPLSEFSKADVIKLAHAKGIAGTYSCHAGGSEPCGRCIACLEFGVTTGG